MPRSMGLRFIPPAALIASSMTFVPASPGTAGEAGPRTRITVTTASDAANGDTSAVADLLTNPGSDGLSLREVILATNNDPGRYEVRFARVLTGAEIRVGSSTGIDLPTLVGGGLWVDGDGDGDGRPDVTLRGFRPPSYCMQADFLCAGLRISSSGNQLRALSLRSFAIGVLFTPLPASDPLPINPTFETRQTYSDNVVRGLVMSDIASAGIGLNWPSFGHLRPSETHNSWVDTMFVDNTIQTRANGIGFKLSGSIGDRLERFTIVDNVIQIVRSNASERIGIVFEAGGGIRNRISNVTIARNTIRGDLHRGVRLGAGVLAGDANTIERVRITDNIVDRSPRVQSRDRDPDGPWCGHCFGIDLFLAEGSGLFDPNLRPIRYADRNRLRDVEISGNTLTGPLRRGVTIQPACCGSSRNRVRGIDIHGNTIRIVGQVEGVHVDGGDCYECPGRRTTGNEVSDVSIDANIITIDTEGRYRGKPPPLLAGGVVLMGGSAGTRDGLINDVSVSGNRIDTNLIGILVLGGEGRRGAVTGLRIEDNRILRDPALGRHLYLDAEEISFIGGWRDATRSRVACVVVRGNGAGEPAYTYVSILDDAAGRNELPDEFPGGNTVTGGCAAEEEEEEVGLGDVRGTGPGMELESESDSGGPPGVLILTLAGLVTVVLAGFVLLSIRRHRSSSGVSRE